MREVFKLWWVWYISALMLGGFGAYFAARGWDLGFAVLGITINMTFKAGQLKAESRRRDELL